MPSTAHFIKALAIIVNYDDWTNSNERKDVSRLRERAGAKRARVSPVRDEFRSWKHDRSFYLAPRFAGSTHCRSGGHRLDLLPPLPLVARKRRSLQPQKGTKSSK